MHMKIPPRIVTPAQKSKDLRGMHTAVRPVRRLATKDPKWNEIIKKLNEAEDEHPPKQELKRIQDNGKLTSAPLQSEDEEMISEDEDWDSFLWNKLASRAQKYIFRCLEDYLLLYYNLDDDPVYEKIMDDVDETKSFNSALDDAIEKNRDFIVESVEKCRQNLNKSHDDDDDIEPINIFGGMARARDVQDGCAWFTGLKCYCDECSGKSLLSTFRNYALIFHAMENDDLIEKIIDVVRTRDPDEEDLKAAIVGALEENKDSILEKYSRFKCGSGLKLNPWIGQM